MSPKPEPGSSDASLARRIRMLRTAMGPEIAAALEDPEVVEVLLNPDGSLWLDRLGSGRAPTGVTLPPAVAERIMYVQLKTGQDVDRGPAWISRVRLAGHGEL